MAARERRPVGTDGVALRSDGPDDDPAPDDAIDGFEVPPVVEEMRWEDDGGEPALMRDELGDAAGTALDSCFPASMLATRRARTSSVFFATVCTHSEISGARAIVVAFSIAPAS